MSQFSQQLNLTILCLHNDPNYLDDWDLQWKKAGIIPLVTSSVDQAMQWLDQHEINIIVMDFILDVPDWIPPEAVNFGRITGIKVVQRIREKKPDVPVFFVTMVQDINYRNKLLHDFEKVWIVSIPIAPDRLLDFIFSHISVW